MKEIITVTGRITSEELGFCQCHEHIALSRGKSFEINPALCIDDMNKSYEELKRYQSHGGKSLIDAQPCGCNRMAAELRQLSLQSGVHIIASTGFHKLSFYPSNHWIHTSSVSDLEELFVSELTEGMFVDGDCSPPLRQSDIKAGIIKAAYDTEELSPRYQRLFQAAARASIRTNRVIMIHIEQNTDPRPLQDYLLNLGVAPKDLIFCHMDRTCKDLRIYKKILQAGSYLEFDTIGRFKYHSDQYEITLFRTLIEAGYQKQLLYSLDSTRARLKAYDSTAIGLDYILTTFNQLLLTAGINEKLIHLFSVENPVRILTQ